MRSKIALRNLYISQAIILLFLIFAYLVWFPHSFSKLGGFTDTAWMIIFVDLVLGPLLVFIVYKKDKKHLTFDINVLLAIQLGAFVWGAYSLYLKHPAYAVFTGDRFTLTNVSAVYPRPGWREQLNKYLFSTPKLVITKFPENKKERNTLLFDVLLKGEPDIDTRPRFFKPFDNHSKEILSKSLKPGLLFVNEDSKRKIEELINRKGGTIEDLAFFPLSGNNRKDVVWVFDRQTAKPVEILDIDPWKVAQK